MVLRRGNLVCLFLSTPFILIYDLKARAYPIGAPLLWWLFDLSLERMIVAYRDKQSNLLLHCRMHYRIKILLHN